MHKLCTPYQVPGYPGTAYVQPDEVRIVQGAAQEHSLDKLAPRNRWKTLMRQFEAYRVYEVQFRLKQNQMSKI